MNLAMSVSHCLVWWEPAVLFPPSCPASLAESGAPFVELHTGCYADARGAARAVELERLRHAAATAREHGLRVNAGHGLDYANVAPVAAIAGVEELNIGFAIVARSVFVGVETALREMLAAIEKERRGG